MADVDNIVRLETGAPWIELLRAKLTGSTSTYTTIKFGNVITAQVDVEGTNGVTWTRSGKTITFTGTNDEDVQIRIIGQK